ncbi:putative fatty acyl-CoA reductase CG5065 [Sitodiplosis mosellana]|uniref:putative fatty acyl-CoA reductase CG5065 n=1 Tax=Sitodiplosis mosellana TaxID=263140 RepID=UPI0024437B1C|nr:putative fatty acyl-CoA reductase CG5065 [Sitodiplosis mosellana]
MSEIAKWYSNKSVFVTGATGFVGKCLVEKLLRDCPDIATIYIIIRPNKAKGFSFEQRKMEYTNHVTFSRLRDTNPSALDKIHIVEGDICQPNLGMSNSDRKLIAETASIIFHSAADVRFDRRLIDAYRTNVSGSKNVLDFATEFKNILAFVLVSTAFSQPSDIGKLEEKHYETSITPELMERIIENIDEDTLDILTPKILENHANTYGFTKGLVEQLVYDYSDQFPTVIARPPIIITSWKEPLSGYTEGIHGINGWALASGRGVLRSMLCQEEYPCNVMPADIIVNGIIVVAVECGKCHEKRLEEEADAVETIKSFEGPMYFNIVEENPLNWKYYLQLCVKPTHLKYPFDMALWYPGGSFKKNRLHHYICIVLFQIIPALLVDLLLIILRHPPFLLKVQRLVFAGSQALEYYMMELFVFKASAYNAVCSRLNNIDRQIFYDRMTMDMDEYLQNAACGTKLYLCKEKLENIPKARIFCRRLRFLDIFSKTLMTYWIAKKVLSYFNVHLSIF